MRSHKVVPFRKERDGISEALLQGLLFKGMEYGLESIIPFPTDKIVIAEWVRLKCRYGCSRYNSNWCCPPATPEPEKARAIIGEYSLALLLAGRQSCTEFYLDNAKKRAKQVRCWKGTISLERMLFLQGYYKAFSLVGETCALCKDCAFPRDCLFPRERRPALESFSVDVIGTLRNLGMTTQVAGNVKETFSYYGIILVE